MKKAFTIIVVAVVLGILFTACDRNSGPDSISSHGAVTPGPSSCTRVCHNAASNSPDPLTTNGVGTAGKHVKHVTDLGIPCDRCHQSYLSNPTHMDGALDTVNPTVTIVYFDAVNPTGAWTSDTGPGTGSCSSLACHGTGNPDWYGTIWNLPSCADCHSAPIRIRRQITDTGGDFALNAGMVSHHVTGAGDPASDRCLVCHELSTHGAGTVRVKNADTGAGIAYSTAASLEPFCLSCHDTDGATNTFVAGGSALSPFSDSSTLGTPPYPNATRIAGSWAKSYGHGTNGNHGAGTKLTCLGTGQPGTGCHGNNGVINAHGSTMQVLASQNFKYDIGSTYVEADFYLCFNCHVSYPGFTKEDVFGVKQGGILDYEYGPSGGQGPNGWNPPYYTAGVTTRFADHNDPAYPDDPYQYPNNDVNFWGTKNANLHWFHTNIGASDYRGTGVWRGFHCVNCHDVHGSMTPYGALYDEIGYYHYQDGINLLGSMNSAAYSTNLLNNNPTYCAFNCHPVQDVTKAWFYPITE